jgi:hypothetical protein
MELRMKKHSDNTPAFEPKSRVKVAHQPGSVERTLEDGRVVVQFDNGQKQPIEPDKIRQE